VAPSELSAPRFSVIVPTHRRRERVVLLLTALSGQTFTDFEAVVVVDGAEEETVTALRAVQTPFDLTVLDRPHEGAAAARNAGAAVARGEILLFLDDDMRPDPALLAEHDRSHREGADLVLGHIPLAADSPATPVVAAVGRWAERRRERLEASGAPIPVPELLTGQLSVRRDVFDRLGGFDTSFTRGGLVPGADRDFGYRARRSGLRIVFNAAAVSHQHYDVDAREYTRRAFDSARGDQILAARYPEIAHELWRPTFDTPPAKLVLAPLAVLPAPFSTPLRELAIRSFSGPDAGALRRRFFFAVQTMERRRGARAGRRAVSGPVAAVLAYHAVCDLSGDPHLAPYGVPPATFAEQLDTVLDAGFEFVDLERLVACLAEGVPLPPRAALLTFDDAYASVLADAAPVLAERSIPAVVFAVTDRLGGTNDWRRTGSTVLPLLDADGLRELAEQGFTVGSHGRTHRSLVALPDDELESELVESAEQLASLGFPGRAAFAYPYGAFDARVADAVERAGYRAAFTVERDVVRPTQNRFALPRFEVGPDDRGRRLARRLRG
jgi:peptidoglycan/xylan/chitin deacetylase (PgdA/CDA1 family)/GT2 family glycosyltransferase